MSRHHKYSGMAKGKEWERLRWQARNRDGWRCAKCGKPGRLEVHHVKPVSEGGDNHISNLLTLCRECHIEIHRPKPNERETAWQQLVAEMR